MNQKEWVLQVLGEPPASALREHGVLVGDGLLSVCESCRSAGRLTVLPSGETKCATHKVRAEFCPCGGRLNGVGKCENGCRQEA
jgi:hypothetical protein